MVRIFKEALKSCNWDTARYTLRFLADLVNCHVVDANSLLKLLESMLDVAKEDGVPDVSYCILIIFKMTMSQLFVILILCNPFIAINFF